jgi:ribosome-associated protein
VHHDAPRPSRTQRKRAVEALQRLGERLVALSPAALRQLALPEELEDAVVACHGMRSREARRRQMQYIGVVMRRLDADVVPRLLRILDVGDLHGLVLGEVVESVHREG